MAFLRRNLLLRCLLAAAWIAGSGGTAGAAPAGGRLFQAASADGGIVVESRDPIANDAIIVLAERMAEQLVPPGGRRSRLVLRAEPQDPSALPRDPQLFLLQAGPRPDFQVTFFVGPHNPPDAWMRKIADALLLRRAVAAGAPLGLAPGAGLPTIPRWIGEGVFQSLSDERTSVERDVVVRARFLGTTPSVETIFGWQELSDDPVFRAWQEAFCWTLYLFYGTDPARTAELDTWFKTLGGPRPAVWRVDEKVEAQWRLFQQKVGEGMEDVLYSWTRTAAGLAAQRTLVLPGRDQRPVRVISWGDLPRVAADPLFPQVLRAKLTDLTVFEMKAHFAWRPVIALYRDALGALLTPKDAASFPARLAWADRAAAQLSDFNGRQADYLNWFEVAHRTGSPATAFQEYFDLSTRFDLWSRERYR